MVKGTHYRSERYLRYIRGQDSCLSWAGGLPQAVPTPAHPVSIAHHVRLGGNGGVGIKPSDYRTVPLTDLEHRALHQRGEKSFWREAGLDPDQIIISLLIVYCGVDLSYILEKYEGDPKTTISELERLAEGTGNQGAMWLHP